MKKTVQLFSTILLVLSFLISGKAIGQLDFGDAPDPTYPTLSANNGAQHIPGPFILGAYLDVEIDGQPSGNSAGDDFNGLIDDEDGLSFVTWLTPNQSATVRVTASMAGLLQGWIDFQGNGNWTDSGDQVFQDQMLAPGVNNLTFNVPNNAANGIYTYGRFRFSTMPGLSFNGIAPDGEVEDYNIVIGVTPVVDVVVDPDAGLSFTQNEISMTLEPISGNLVAAYNDNPYPGGPGIGVSYSADGGQNWSSSQLALPIGSTGLPLIDNFDPTITADDSGNVFVAHIATDGNWAAGPESSLVVNRSSDGGVTWTGPLIVDLELPPVSNPDPAYRFNDRCQIWVDRNPSSPHYNNIYIAWIKDRGWNSPQPWSDIYISISNDGGANFSAANQINNVNNDLGNMPVPTVAANGDLYVLWMNYNVITGGNGTIFFNRSTDGGINWGTDTAINTIPLPPLWLNGGTDVLAKGASVIRAHPTNPNELYVVYASDPDGAGPDEADIFFTRTVNAGVSWSNAIRINDDSTTNDQVLPWMDITPNGIIDIVWYDRRSDGSDLTWDVYGTTSIDGGLTFANNFMVNALSFPTPQPKNGLWFGEYLALSSDNNKGYVAFTSSLIDIQGDVFFASFNNPILGIEDRIKRDVVLHPNPTTGILNIESETTITQIEVYDLLGQLVVSNSNQNIIDISSVSQGIYFVKIKDENGNVGTQKVVKK